jgi:hypothetical protein
MYRTLLSPSVDTPLKTAAIPRGCSRYVAHHGIALEVKIKMKRDRKTSLNTYVGRTFHPPRGNESGLGWIRNSSAMWVPNDIIVLQQSVLHY